MKSRCPLCGKKVSSRDESCPQCGARLKDAPEAAREASKIHVEHLENAKREGGRRIDEETPAVHVHSFEEGQETPNKKSASPLERKDTVLLVLSYLFSVGFPILGMVFAGMGLEQSRKSKKKGLPFAYGFGLALSMLCFVLWIVAFTW